MDANEARRRAERVRNQKEFTRQTARDEQRRQANENWRKLYCESDEQATEKFVQGLLAEIKTKIDTGQVRRTSELNPSRRRLTLRGWDYRPCLPLYIGAACDRLQALGYMVEVKLKRAPMGGPYVGGDKSDYAEINFYW